MNPNTGRARGTRRDWYSREPEQDGVHDRHEALSEEDPVVLGSQRMAGDQRICSCSGLPQGHYRQEADDAGEDGAGFQYSRRRRSPARPPSFCLLTTGNSTTAVPMPARATMISKMAADDDGSVRARADDVVRIVQHRA